MNKRLICQRCKHYYVTWESNKSHGCRAFGFKSKQIPSAVVLKNSGIACSLYEQKNFITKKD